MEYVFPLHYSTDLPAPLWADEEVDSQRARMIFTSKPYPHSSGGQQAFDISQVTYDLLSSARHWPGCQTPPKRWLVCVKHHRNTDQCVSNTTTQTLTIAATKVLFKDFIWNRPDLTNLHGCTFTNQCTDQCTAHSVPLSACSAHHGTTKQNKKQILYDWSMLYLLNHNK